MIDNKGTILRNLEDQVQYLTDINQLASLGFRVKGTTTHSSFLVVDATCVNGDIMIVGTGAPYHLWTFVIDEWIDLGEFPRSGPPGARGATGATGRTGPMGPQGPVGATGATGKAGKNGDGLGVENISAIDLATGATTVTYETDNATLSKQGKIVAAGEEYSITVTDKLPIVAGDNVTIDANGTNSALKIGAKVPVTSVNGQKGDVRLTIPTSTSQLVNDAEFITASYHDPEKQNILVSGDNIKTINNESILGSGNITISGGGGGGGGTDTGFDNVREIQAADNQTTYNPDTKEYIISSGNADIFYKDGTKTTIPYVQEIGLMAGDNITFTEEFVDNANYRVKINATGGGSGSSGNPTNGFYPYNVKVTDNPTVGSTYSYADSNVTYPTNCSYFQGQMIIDTNGVIYKVIGTTMCTCVYIPQGIVKPAFSLVLPTNVTFPYTGTLTDEQKEFLTVYPIKLQLIDVQITSSNGDSNYNTHYLCSNDFLDSYNGAYGSTYWAQYDDTKKIKVAFSYDTKYGNGSYTISLVESSGGGGGSASIYQHTITMQGSQYKYSITVVNSHQGSITSPSIWKEIYGKNKFTVPAIVTDAMEQTVSISSAYVYINPMNGLSILFFPSNGSSQSSETISSSSTWEDNIISL